MQLHWLLFAAVRAASDRGLVSEVTIEAVRQQVLFNLCDPARSCALAVARKVAAMVCNAGSDDGLRLWGPLCMCVGEPAVWEVVGLLAWLPVQISHLMNQSPICSLFVGG